MNDYPRLKIRKGKQNSQGRQFKTQYQPKEREVSIKNNISPMFDSIDITRCTERTKPLQIKFIPMRSVEIAKKLTTEPQNTKRINRTQKVAVDEIFKHQPIKKTHKIISESFSHRVKEFSGKDRYEIEQEIGSGTFGKVYRARDRKTLDLVAIKKVFQDKKYKNRQLEILKLINHPNILKMRDCYFTFESQKQYLNVVMDHFSTNLYDFIDKNLPQSQIPKLLIKILAYQLFRGLLYLQVQEIAHRDIKPQNILVNEQNWKLVICDFGSAKKLKKGQPNISYICSRSYRAPQLIFGCTEYTQKIDMWSAGCVLAQMLKVQPIFKGRSSSQHLMEIIKVFGTPTPKQIMQMNPKFDVNQFKMPIVTPKQLPKILGKHNVGQQFNDLLSKIFKYSPQERLSPFEALKHPFFDQLRQQHIYKKIVKQYDNLQLFNFKKTKEVSIHNISELIPKWYK